MRTKRLKSGSKRRNRANQSQSRSLARASPVSVRPVTPEPRPPSPVAPARSLPGFYLLAASRQTKVLSSFLCPPPSHSGRLTPSPSPSVKLTDVRVHHLGAVLAHGLQVVNLALQERHLRFKVLLLFNIHTLSNGKKRKKGQRGQTTLSDPHRLFPAAETLAVGSRAADVEEGGGVLRIAPPAG